MVDDRGTYLLEELDGTLLRGTFAANALRAFKIRQREIDVDEDVDGVEHEAAREYQAAREDEAARKDDTVQPARSQIRVNIPPLPVHHRQYGSEDIPRR